MTYMTELSSWLFAPKAPKASSVPQVGQPAPRTAKIPIQSNKRTIVAFLRHCGCPFAEKTFVHFRDAAKRHTDIDFIAVSHSNQEATDKWLKSLPNYGSEPKNLRLVVDDKLEAYAAWGVGSTGIWHVLNPTSLGSVSTLAKEGFNVRSTESGSRWQGSATYAVGADGKIKYGGLAKSADDLPDIEQYVKETSS